MYPLVYNFHIEKKWNIRFNPAKSVHIDFFLCIYPYGLVLLSGDVTALAFLTWYLELHFDQHLKWKTHTPQIDVLDVLFRLSLSLFLNHRPLLYLSTFQPIWMYVYLYEDVHRSITIYPSRDSRIKPLVSWQVLLDMRITDNCMRISTFLQYSTLHRNMYKTTPLSP